MLTACFAAHLQICADQRIGFGDMARIAFDMDGVIVDTYAGQRDWLSKTYPELIAQADGKKFKREVYLDVFPPWMVQLTFCAHLTNTMKS